MNIEESIQQIKTLIEAWQLDEADLNQTDINAMQVLLKENQELKKHLKVPKACNLKTLEDYKSYYEDTTREQILEDTYIEYCAYVNLAHRYSELKKQVEERTKMYQNAYDYSQKMEGNAIILETQQKEFIKYLEDLIKQNETVVEVSKYGLSKNCSKLLIDFYKEVLQKYKEIIGDDK